MSTTIVVLQGDQTGQELLEEALRVLDPALLGLDIQFERFDLSLGNRRATHNRVVFEAAEAMVAAGYGLKAATITPESKDDVGSPNALLRKAIDGKVIIRTGRRIPGVRPIAGVHAPISVVRMAVGDAYGAKEWRTMEDGDEIAYRTERISRGVCHSVAEFSFLQARRLGARVFGGPKYTVSPIYEGMLKEEMDAAAARHLDVVYEPQLIDATYALLLSSSGGGMVVPALNRDGDCLSDMVLQMFGSIAGSESLLLSFDETFRPRTVMAEAPHGTAPGLQGKNVANPMAMILAGASLLAHLPSTVTRKRVPVPEGRPRGYPDPVPGKSSDPHSSTIADQRAQHLSGVITDAVFACVEDGVRTADIGGQSLTSEFTDAVIARVRAAFE